MIAPPISSTLPARSGAAWPRWIREAPSLTAEALERVRDPLALWLDPGDPAPPARVAARLARGLLPPADPDPPPSWLRSDQQLSFARGLAAVRRYGGALLADRPGTGKSWIGLAIATTLEPGRPIPVIGPATLREQWLGIGRSAGVEIRFHSHELLSRSRTPLSNGKVFVLDESHRFRNPRTRRYLSFAPWCVGRRGILLSATPAVNRLADVVHQLELVVRDDVLAWAGIPSLGGVEPPGQNALARLLITGEDRSGDLPARWSRDFRMAADPGTLALLPGLLGLRCSSDPAIAALIRVSLLAALASSPEAVSDAMVRYRALLLHARDAASSGRGLTRQIIRQFVGSELDQLVLWPLVAEPARRPELVLADLEALPQLLAMAREWTTRSDAKCRTLAEITNDRKPTLIFTNARATVRYLRRQLGKGVAWCTGEHSGIDQMQLPREAVLDLFRKRAVSLPPERRPVLLIATDVAAEGLDLPLLARVVHYDLPWTAVRLDQRTGRAFRLGSDQGWVEVIRLLPPAPLERELGREAVLIRKDGLPRRIGLGDDAGAPWRLRSRIAQSWEREPQSGGMGWIRGGTPGMVAGLRLGFSDGQAEDVVFARTRSGWTHHLSIIASMLEEARTVPAEVAPNPASRLAATGQVAALARRWLRAARSGRIAAPLPDLAARRIRRRLRELARGAAIRRDRIQLASIERGGRFVRRGHTAGERMLLESWNALPSSELLRTLARRPDEPTWAEIEQVELFAMLLVEPGGSPR